MRYPSLVQVIILARNLQYWPNLQSRYDLYIAENTLSDPVAEQVRYLTTVDS
jgi:plasmid maintenance system antidote protein VapI